MINVRQSILVFVDYYLPGYKAGGPIRTIANMVDQLSDELDFRIITRDRDLGDARPYPSVVVDSWQSVGKAKVFYLSLRRLSLLSLNRLIRATEHDAIYLNSFFSPCFSIKPLLLRRLSLIPKKPVIVAPRGEFSPGALRFKNIKKRAYIGLSRLLGFYRGVIWQASSEHEKVYISRWFGNRIPVILAPNLPPIVCQTKNQSPRRQKTVGCLKALFLGRISRNKNLDAALKMLNGLKGKVQFNIYGPIEDHDYWAECHKIIKLLPENIVVQNKGAVSHDQVTSIMMDHDLFLLPTLGENFGHVILEALVVGCPVLISDQTPWRGLKEKGVGWDLSLSEWELFRKVLQDFIAMDNIEYVEWSSRARKYGLQVLQNDKVVEQNRQLFYKAIADSVTERNRFKR